MSEIIQTVRVTRSAYGRTLETLEMLWFLRDQAERRLSDHANGVHLTAEEWDIVNIPDAVFADPAAKINPEWKKIKDEWFAEAELLAKLVTAARRNVRIATGHEPIGKMVCRA